MDDSAKQEQPEGNNSSPSIFFQSSRIQRSVCFYNELHTFLLECSIRYVFICRDFVFNILYNSIFRQEKK
jgi:hypothetical protein